MKLKRDFYLQDCVKVARDLLGKVFVHEIKEGITKGIIVETEAYNGAIDKASHSYKYKRTKRTEIQFGLGGYAYVYFIYGMHFNINIVTGVEGEPQGVLIRGIQPTYGIDLMKGRRNTDNLSNLTNGPAKLCQAMGITKEQYGMDLCNSNLYIEEGITIEDKDVDITKRINIDYAEEDKDRLWRFSIKDNPFVSIKVKS